MLSGPLFVGNGVMLEYSEWLPNSMFLASLVVSEETVGVEDSEGVLLVGAHAARDVSPRESDVIAPVMRRRRLECWPCEQRPVVRRISFLCDLRDPRRDDRSGSRTWVARWVEDDDVGAWG